MNYLFEISTSFIECITTHLLFATWFGRRNITRGKFLGGLFLYFLINCGYTFLPIPPIIRAVCAIVAVAGIGYFLYDVSIFQASYGAITNTVVNVIAEMLTMELMAFLSFDFDALMEYGLERIYYVSTAKIINVVAILIVTTFIGRRRSKFRPLQALPLLVCQIISIYICHVFYRASSLSQEMYLQFVLVISGLLYINLIMIVFVDNMIVTARAKQEKALAEQNYSLQRDYYEQVQRDQAHTHALWHDIKKHVIAMEAMSAANNTQAMKENLELVKHTFASVGTQVDVGNMEANVILNHCIQKAEASGIKVVLDVSIPEKLNLSAIDLSVIIGNTMDNAIEASHELEPEKRIINVMLKQRNQLLFYYIDNACVTVQPKKKGKIHGFGLQNVRSSVEKYNGEMIAEQRDNHYYVDIRLNLPA